MTENVHHTKHQLIGTVVADRYEIVSFIGQGAMGAVYKAKHKAFDRYFAVKTLNSSNVDDDRSLLRFKQEAQAMSVLTHPNLIAIADYGQMDCGPFFVMEYLEGISLADYIRKNGPMPVEQALPIFAQIADALAHAHGKSLIHRDLKPSNVMLIGDSRDFVKVVDLGIAKALAPEEDEAQSLTKTGEVFGSPLYMSPEQCMGTPLDRRSDIYSLGCLMYEVLTAHPPLKGANFIQTVYKHMNDMPQSLTAMRGDVPQELEDVIFGCLAKKPEDRISSMSELRDKLRQIGCPTGSNLLSSTAKNTTIKPVQNYGAVPMPVLKGPGFTPGNTLNKAAPDALEPAPKLGRWTSASTKLCALAAAAMIGLAVVAVSRKEAPPLSPPGATPAVTAAVYTAPANTTITVASPVYEFDNKAAADEVDVVGIYAADQTNNEKNPVDVKVTVLPKKKPITLVLFSYMPVHWKVSPLTGARIEKVVASGFFDQKVSPPSTCSNVQRMCASTHGDKAFNTSNLFHTEQSMIAQNRNQAYAQITAAVDRILHKKIRKFKGGFYGKDFEI